MTVASPDEMRHYDALYEPFPPFSDWPRLPGHLVAQWDELVARLEALRAEATEGDFADVREEAMRAAAWDTGAIEGLYTTDRGFTITVATQAAGWETEVRREKGDDALAMFKAQLEAYRQALDAATEATPISEAWIRHLHEVVTAAQGKYTVHTAAGGQEHDLPKGEYKRYPNHILRADGRVFAHAPVAGVSGEMGRLVEELRSAAFTCAHPVEQASYAHYGLVRVHPFADGNGRVARALASVFTLRAASLPLAVFADERPRYLQALETADSGQRAAFERFVYNSLAESVRDASALLRHLLARDSGQQSEKGSFAAFRATRSEEDAAAESLLREAAASLDDAFDRYRDEQTQAWVTVDDADDNEFGLANDGPEAPPGYRPRRRSLRLLAQTRGHRRTIALFYVMVATEMVAADPFRLVSADLVYADVGFSLEGLLPSLTQRSKARLRRWAENVAAQLVAEAGGPTAGPGGSAG